MTTTLRNEWRLLRHDRVIWLTIAAYLLLLVYGSVLSVSRVWARVEQTRVGVADYEQRWQQLRAAADQPISQWGDWRSPSLVGGPSGYALTWMPVEGLAALSTGEAARRPTVKTVSIYPSAEQPPLENPLAPAGGLFDLGLVVQWLMPLSIIGVVHGVVSGDRLRGTWRLIAATAASPSRIVLSRLLLPTTVIVGATMVVAVVDVQLASALTTGGQWARLAAWGAALTVYASIWATLAAAVSARSSSPGVAMAMLGLVWMATVWVIPGIIDLGIIARHPPPNRLASHLAARESQRDLENRLPEMMERVYHDHPEWRPSAERVAAANTPVPGGPRSRDSRRVYAPSLVAVESAAPFLRAETERRERVERAVQWMSVLSAPLAFQLVADHLAGASPARFTMFDRHVATQEEMWHGFFAPRIMRLEDMTRRELDAVPTPSAFTAQPPPADLVPPILGLGAALAAAVLVYRLSQPALRQ